MTVYTPALLATPDDSQICGLVLVYHTETPDEVNIHWQPAVGGYPVSGPYLARLLRFLADAAEIDSIETTTEGT